MLAIAFRNSGAFRRAARLARRVGRYCRTGGGFVGQGDCACGAGDAVIGAGAGVAAAGLGCAARFAGGFFAGFFAVDGAAGESSTTTGLGRSLVGSPVVWITSSLSVSGW